MSNQYYQRAQVLYQQHRFSQAAQELRAGSLESTADANSYALLALCLVNIGELEEAESEARRAVIHSPGNPFGHYALSFVYFRCGQLRNAELSAREAIRLSPAGPDYLALLANIQLSRDHPKEALESAEQGLAVDPDHAGSLNLRTMALIKMGRKEEAASAVQGALSAHPNDALAHANQGWAWLHQGKYRESLASFREALRVDPDLQWARQGMLTALKARYPIYRWMLAYFLLMGRLSRRMRWAIVIGFVVAMQLLNATGQASKQVHLPAMVIVAAYGAFVFLSWTIDPFFNLLMRVSPYGRYLLTPDQRRSSTVAACLIAAAVTVATAAIFLRPAELIFIAFSSALLIIPACAIFRLPKGWRRVVAGIFVIAVGAMVIGAAVVPDVDAGVEIILVSVVVSTWVFRFLNSSARRK